jgi:hypothetical protein
MSNEVRLVRQQDSAKVSVGDVFEEMTNGGFIKQFTVTEVDPITGKYFISEPKLKGEFHEGKNRHARRAMKTIMKKMMKNGKFSNPMIIKPEALPEINPNEVTISEGEGVSIPNLDIEIN